MVLVVLVLIVVTLAIVGIGIAAFVIFTVDIFFPTTVVFSVCFCLGLSCTVVLEGGGCLRLTVTRV